MGLGHGWLSLFLMICTEHVDKSKLLGIPKMLNIWTPGAASCIPIQLIFMLACWPNDLQLWSHHFKYLMLLCVWLFSPPSLIGPQPAGRRLLFPSCFRFKFWWPAFSTWHQIVKFTKLCEAAKDPPVAFFLFDRIKVWSFDLKQCNLYENKSKSKQHTEGSGKY